MGWTIELVGLGPSGVSQLNPVRNPGTNRGEDMAKVFAYMGRIIGLGIVAFLFSGCSIDINGVDWQDNSGDEEASQMWNQTLKVDGQMAIRILGQNGTVTIIGVEGVDEVTIRADKRVRSRSFRDAREHLPLLDVNVHGGSEEIVIETDQPRDSNGRSYIVDYEITLPKNLKAFVYNGNGAVTVEDLGADLLVEVGNGNVDIAALVGSSWVSVGNGVVESSVFLPTGGQAVYAVGNGSVSLAVQPLVSAQLNARVGNGTISVTGLAIVDPVQSTGIFTGRLGSGSGLIDLTVGNGWVQVRGK